MTTYPVLARLNFLLAPNFYFNKRNIQIILAHKDTTHKVMWEWFSLFLNGTTDMCRSYHPQCLSICTQETEKEFEFEFAFNAIKDSLLTLFA